MERIEAMREALSLSQPNIYDLQKLGYHKNLCEGIINAIKHYKNIDLQRYVDLVSDALLRENVEELFTYIYKVKKLTYSIFIFIKMIIFGRNETQTLQNNKY